MLSITGRKARGSWWIVAASLVSLLAVEGTVRQMPVKADVVLEIDLPEPLYSVSVNAPIDAPSPMRYTGRGSWTDVELDGGGLAVPLFKVGTDQKVPFRSSVIVSDLGGASAIRAALDGVSASSPGDECFGGTVIEKGALTMYVLEGGSWVPASATLVTHEDQGGESACEFLKLGLTGVDQVMFVVDLFCRSVDCSSVDGQPAGGTSLLIEVEGSGDGVFNTGLDGGGEVAAGDEAYEVVLGTESVERFDGDDMVNGLTNSRDTFADEDESSGLLQVPECSDESDVGPCLEDPENNIDQGWEVMLIDRWGELTLRPWRSVYPFHISSGDRVDLALRLPTGTWRGLDIGETEEEGFSIARSSAFVDSFVYDEDTGSRGYSVVNLSLEARETTTVTRFGKDESGGELFFDDGCRGSLGVRQGTVFLDSDGDDTLDDGEELVADCQSEDEAVEVQGVSLWGVPGGDGDRAWVYAPDHVFVENDEVAVCCVYGAFDGLQRVVEVGDPYVEGSTDWFAFDTSNGSFNDRSFPLNAAGDPGYEVVEGQAVERSYIRVAATSVTLNVVLEQPLPFDPEANDNNQFLAGSFISSNAQAVAFGDAMFDPSNPAYDFGLAGPSSRADGTSRSSDGFFRACVTDAFIDEVWGLTVAQAQTRIDGRTASDLNGRNDPLRATIAPGSCSGLLVELDQFGFSAPYFAVRPRPRSSGGGGSSPTTPAPGSSTVTPSPDGSSEVSIPLSFGTVTVSVVGASGSGAITVTPRTGTPSSDSRGLVIPGAWLDISSTIDDFESIELCVPVEFGRLSALGLRLEDLRLFHWDQGVRTDITTGLDSSGRRLCGRTASLSPFAVGALRTERVSGVDRYETAVAISRANFSVTGRVVYLVTGEKFADGLSAGAAAGRERGPVLLTKKDSVPGSTAAELRRLAPSRIIVVGGPAVISETVISSLADISPTAEVERVFGNDRFETSARVARRLFDTVGGTVYVGSGLGFTEMLAASAAAGRDRAPLLMVPGSGPARGVPTAVEDELKRLSPSKVVVVGGAMLVADTVVDRIRDLLPGATIDQVGGVDAYDTASKLARTFDSGGTLYVATGAVFADGLAGGAVAAAQGRPLVMIPPSGEVPSGVRSALSVLGPDRVIVLGGPVAVDRRVENVVARYMSK